MGYFSSTTNWMSKTRPSKSCGCSKKFRYNERKIKVLVEREAFERGYTFVGFVDKYTTLMKTKITLNCKTHGNWSSCTISNFMRKRECPGCAEVSRRSLKVTDKSEELLSLLSAIKYTSLSEIHNKIRLKDRLLLSCNRGHIFDISVGNFIRGRRCPHCVGKNMNILYVNWVDSKIDNKTFIKVGITKDLDHRIATQNGKNKLKLSLWHAWEFKSVADCKECERRIKKRLSRPSGVDFKSLFKDGHSEVFEYDKFWTYRDIEEIVEDYPTYKYIPDKKMSNFWSEVCKNIIVK